MKLTHDDQVVLTQQAIETESAPHVLVGAWKQAMIAASAEACAIIHDGALADRKLKDEKLEADCLQAEEFGWRADKRAAPPTPGAAVMGAYTVCPKCHFRVVHGGAWVVCLEDDCHYSTRPSRYAA